MKRTFQRFYRGKRVFITGHTGFKGGWLAEWLTTLGADVAGFSLPREQADLPGVPAADGVGVSSTHGDIRDLPSLSRAMQEHEPSIVFHLAAQPLVRRAYRDPVDTYTTNVIGTVNVLEAVRATPSVQTVVVVTSDKCYDNREWPYAYRESDPMGGKDPYSASKGCTELVVSSYRESFFRGERKLGIATVRAGNVIGGGDWSEDRIVPDIVRAIAANEPVFLRLPQAIRPWQHVLEPLRGYLELARRLHDSPDEMSEGWNFGPGPEDTVPVADLTRTFIDCWGAGEMVCLPPSAEFKEAMILRLDCGKARSRLNWSPLLRLRDALELSAAWYRTALESPSHLAELSRDQIETYMSLASADEVAEEAAEVAV